MDWPSVNKLWLHTAGRRITHRKLQQQKYNKQQKPADRRKHPELLLGDFQPLCELLNSAWTSVSWSHKWLICQEMSSRCLKASLTYRTWSSRGPCSDLLSPSVITGQLSVQVWTTLRSTEDSSEIWSLSPHRVLDHTERRRRRRRRFLVRHWRKMLPGNIFLLQIVALLFFSSLM